MKKVAIVGVEGSGKTVMLAGLGDLYTYPDEEGYFLSPKNFGTAAYVAEKIERMRKGEWPAATAGDEMQGLDWTLKQSMSGECKRPDTICEVSFLDFAGEVYRTAFGIGTGDASLAEQTNELKRYVSEADDLIVLINLRDVIVHGIRDHRVQEAMWITKSILDTALSGESGHKTPRTAIVLSQSDSYEDTIKSCGDAKGVLKKYLPYVANDYGWLDVFAVNAVDKTVLDGDGNAVPAVDFTSKGLLPIMTWIRGNSVSGVGARGTSAPSGGESAEGVSLSRSDDKTGGVSGVATAAKRVQLWEGGPFWADRNIGAEQPWACGDYFWWGDVAGYKYRKGVVVSSDGLSSSFSFSEEKVPTCQKSIVELKRNGWITADGILVPAHDAAQARWGGGWRMPTRQELNGLCDKCDWTWAEINGINGYAIRGRGDYASKSIFLPCAGCGYGPSLFNAGSGGNYWSSVPCSDSNYYAWGLYFFSSGHHDTDSYDRRYGQSVRPVQGFTK